MLDKKEIRLIKEGAEKSIKNGEIVQGKKEQFIHFFLKNASDSLETAKLLFEVSTKENIQNSMGMPKFNGFLWVINSSYYSMFYTARALLDSRGISIKAENSVHTATFNALFYYFYLNGKLERKFIEDLKEAGEEAFEILGKEKAKEFIENYSSEKEKRSRFTYDLGEIAIKGKAETSLNRAKKFNEEARKIIGDMN